MKNKETIVLQTLTLQTLLDFFAKGRFATVVFTKKGDGSTRVLNGKTKVLNALKGGQPAYNASERNQVRVCDVNLRDNGVRKPDYRTVTVDNVKEIRANGKVYVVANVVPEVHFITEPNYNGATKELSMRLNGDRTYTYKDVPALIGLKFVNSDHKGAMFNAIIKNRYDFTKV